jgi:hypothetical protein
VNEAAIACYVASHGVDCVLDVIGAEAVLAYLDAATAPTFSL